MLMGDLLALAFQTDLTRIATFVFANDGSNRSYRGIGVPDGHHDVSHHGGEQAKREEIRKINQFDVAQVAYLLQTLKSISEQGGTLLDHCMIVYGSGISDGNYHGSLAPAGNQVEGILFNPGLGTAAGYGRHGGPGSEDRAADHGGDTDGTG